MRKRRLVLLSQVYVPDPASVGQHLHDIAAEMARRGNEVIVRCSSRGYDDPDKRYKLRETRDGVAIRRYRLPIFSKKNIVLRIFGSAWAMMSLFFSTLFTRHIDCLFFSTSPPLVGFMVIILAKLKGCPTVYWAMDLNPDQLIAMNKLREGSILHWLLEKANRFVIKNADVTVALDRFMEGRLRRPGRRPKEILVMPPWPHESVLEPLPHEDNAFRANNAWADKFVVMYSGNHTPANPLDTLLAAALELRDDPDIRFAFIGGGLGKAQVNEFLKQHQLPNATSLPYQPLETLRHSLSAADVHVVSLGDDMVGIIHPCKVYGSMAVGRPVLFLGPRPSHVSDLLEHHQIGLAVEHGQVQACIDAIRDLQHSSFAQRARMGERAQDAMRQGLSKPILLAKMADRIDKLMSRE